jgi:hypothetical protein
MAVYYNISLLVLIHRPLNHRIRSNPRLDRPVDASSAFQRAAPHFRKFAIQLLERKQSVANMRGIVYMDYTFSTCFRVSLASHSSTTFL